MAHFSVKMPSGRALRANLRDSSARGLRQWATSVEHLTYEDIVLKCEGQVLEAWDLQGFEGKQLEVTLVKKKNVALAYFFWLIGWWCGLHHWYLEREGQAFLWMTSLGGFGIGSVLDFFFIPGYVREANGHFKKGRGSTSFGFCAFVTYLLFATYYTLLLKNLGEWPAYWAGNFLGMASLTFGRRTIGIPSYQGICVLMVIQLLSLLDQVPTPLARAIQFFVRTAFGAAQRRRPDGVPPTGRKSRPLRVLLFLGSAVLIAATSHYIEYEDQRTLAEAFVSGKLLSDMQLLYKRVYNLVPQEWSAMLSGEEKKALRVLGLEKGATTQEIKKAWRKKSLKFHPDHNPDALRGAMEEVNEAYATLNKIYELRGGK